MRGRGRGRGRGSGKGCSSGKCSAGGGHAHHTRGAAREQGANTLQCCRPNAAALLHALTNPAPSLRASWTMSFQRLLWLRAASRLRIWRREVAPFANGPACLHLAPRFDDVEGCGHESGGSPGTGAGGQGDQGAPIIRVPQNTCSFASAGSRHASVPFCPQSPAEVQGPRASKASRTASTPSQ